MYAIVKTGGKQYRVEQGMSLLVERLRADEGAKVALDPLLFVDGEKVIDGDGVKVEAKVVGHERGPKLRIVKFKPKRGYKRRTGHRQELTRLEVSSIKPPAARGGGSRSAAASSEGGGSRGGGKSSGRRAASSSRSGASSSRGGASSSRRAPSKTQEAEDGS